MVTLGYGRAARQSGRIESVHSLRGLAALTVVLYHFSNNNSYFYVPPVLKAIGGQGWLGVEVFFVVSGFILPYSLWKGGYRSSPSNFRLFLWKRVVRLDPPYFVTIALTLLLAFLAARTPGYHGPPFKLDPVQVGLHVGYLAALAGSPWLNPVFWTLAIELQFYILIPLILPLVVSRSQASRMTTLGILLIVSTAYSHDPVSLALRPTVITYYLPLFICGIAAFQWFAGICARWEAAVILLASAVILGVRMGPAIMVIGLATAFIIVVMPLWTNRSLAFLGTISYSLYLVHVPVGGRIIDLAQRLPPSAAVAVIGIAAALAGSIATAHILYRTVERPAQSYAASLRFGRESRTFVAEAVPVMEPGAQAVVSGGK